MNPLRRAPAAVEAKVNGKYYVYTAGTAGPPGLLLISTPNGIAIHAPGPFPYAVAGVKAKWQAASWDLSAGEAVSSGSSVSHLS